MQNTDIGRLAEIDHIVVLMMENRSFDHMLGFLSIEQGRNDISGPTEDLQNEYRGELYRVHPATSTKLRKEQDPCHSGWCVDEQLANGSSGFVSNYVKTRKGKLIGNPGVVMAWHTAEQLPVYDFLAAHFCVCDHWFCSVAGATMPNRCYAIAGTSGGKRDNQRPTRPYNFRSFARHLDEAGVSWRWYSHDYVPMIWMIDPAFGLDKEAVPAYFDRRDILGHRSFLQRAAAGELPAVSWIDPNFYDLTYGPAGSNDDHPPSDLRAGQKLVLQLFDALNRSELWPKTLLVITYDEHGGFYDHIEPPEAVDDSPDPKLKKYGPRVPAIVVSPWVGTRSASSTEFDHSSIIKTILTRFCRDDDGTIPDMGARVQAANHLGELLTEAQARPAIAESEYEHLASLARGWHEELVHAGALEHDVRGPAVLHELTDFQADFLGAKKELLAARTLLTAAKKAGVPFLP